jgi:hypothetical protein
MFGFLVGGHRDETMQTRFWQEIVGFSGKAPVAARFPMCGFHRTKFFTR